MKRATLTSKRLVACLALGALLAAACAPAAPTTQPETGSAPSQQQTVSRTLRIGIRVEPASLARNPPREGQTTNDTMRRLFNAELAIMDDSGAIRPFLAAELPQLNTDSWRVFSDGRMETIYRLKPGLTWHDGAALTAEDFAFGWRVMADPSLGRAGLIPQKLMEEIVAPDPLTVLIRWTQPFPDADSLNILFSPLPAHLLKTSFEQMDMDAFANHPYWSAAFVGAGPYKLTRWEPGAFIEGDAFPGFALGRAKIDRVRLTFAPDPNGAITRLLADDVDMLADSTLKSQQLPALEQDWLPKGGGNIIGQPASYRAAMFQMRPELATPAGLLDVRVRKALAHAMDKQAVNEVIYRGAAILTTNPFLPSGRYAALTERATIKYPHDVRRAEQLMLEAGYTRGSDGVFTHPSQGRFSAELRTNASDQFETEMHIVADTWRRAGFDFSEAITPPALIQDPQTRATFTGVYIYGGGDWESALRSYHSSLIPSADNRWGGGNRGAWRNAEWERLLLAYDTTLDHNQRGQIAAQMARIYTDELPAIAMEFDPHVIAYVKALSGPKGGPREATVWNLHEWELR